MNYGQRETAREVRLWIGQVIVPEVVGITGLVALHPELKDKAKIQVNRIKNKIKNKTRGSGLIFGSGSFVFQGGD